MSKRKKVIVWRTLGKVGSCLVLVVGVLTMAGCNRGQARLQGKVTVKGQPARGGTLTFSPVASAEDKTPGRPASAVIQPDGTFTAGTNSTSDGVKIGKVRISFTPPQPDLNEAQRSNPKYIVPPPLYMGMVPKPNEIEVKPGSNTQDIELVYPKR